MKKFFIKNKEKIIILLSAILVFILMFSEIIIKKVNNLDEIWNYNTAIAIMKGLIPYKEISMITTPLLPTLVALFLKTTINKLIVFRILAALLSTAIIVMTYKNAKIITKNITESFIISGLVLYIIKDYFALDYNYFCLLLAEIISFMELKRIQKNNFEIIPDKKKNIIVGIIAGLAICTKQTLGSVIAFVLIFDEILNIKSKEKIKPFIKNAVYKITGILIPTIILIIYLVANGAMGDFINYAILGIKTFDNSIGYFKLFESQAWEIDVFSVTVPIYFVVLLLYTVITRIINKKITIVQQAWILSIPMLIAIYPIADGVHFFIGSTMIIANIFTLITTAINGKYNILKWKYKELVGAAIFAFIITIGVYFSLYVTFKNFQYYNSLEKETELKQYEYLGENKAIKEVSSKLKEFIENNKETQVYVLDAEAAIYDIPLNIYNKNYDMFLKGNIGKDGEDGIISDIEESKNTIFLIKQEGYNLNWQTPTKVLDYIRQNLEKRETVSMFDIYYKE